MPGNPCLWSIRLTMESDGTITLSLTGLKNDVEEHELWNILEKQGTVIKEETTIRGTAYTKTKTVKQTFSWQGSGAGVVIKAVPSQLLAIFAADYIPRALFDLNTYTYTVKIISGTTYLEKTETVEAVLHKLGLNVRIPAGLNYQVTNITIKEGADAHQILKSLFPIPGATIVKIRDTWFVNISLDSEILEALFSNLCVTQNSTLTQPILLSAIGATAKPNAVKSEEGGGDICDAVYQSNLIGGIFGILKIEITSSSETNPL